MRAASRFVLTSGCYVFACLLAVEAWPLALGVAVAEITPEIQPAAGLQQATGVLIRQVVPNGAAAQAGLQVSDLILGVDAAGVSGSDEVVQRIGRHRVGELVTLVLLRPNALKRVQQMQVYPVLQPAPTGATPNPAAPQRPTPAAISPPRQRPTTASSPLGIGFSGGVLPVRRHVDLYRTCMAFAPANWLIYGSRREGDALDMAAADGSMAAGYGIGAKPGFMVQNAPQRYGTPQIAIYNSLSQGGRLQVRFGQPIVDQTFGYTWLPYETGDPSSPTPPAKGVVLFLAWPLLNDPPGYIIVTRQAQTAKHLWERHGAQAIAVALSIRCTRQLQPSPDAAGRRPPAGDDQMESTYNQQLGMEYAHDTTTGENYWVSPGTDWHESGPDGPGYYRRSGNELRRLAPGRSN